MLWRRRLSFVIAALIVFSVGSWLVLSILPQVELCRSVWCGPNFDVGVSLIGDQVLTMTQTIAVTIVLGATACLLAKAALPSAMGWTAAGFGILAIALAVAFALPTRVLGVAPSVPCSTPGPNGPVPGTCVIGATAEDRRVAERVLILAMGMCCLVFAAGLDRAKVRAQSGVEAPAAPSV